MSDPVGSWLSILRDIAKGKGHEVDGETYRFFLWIAIASGLLVFGVPLLLIIFFRT